MKAIASFFLLSLLDLAAIVVFGFRFYYDPTVISFLLLFAPMLLASIMAEWGESLLKRPPMIEERCNASLALWFKDHMKNLIAAFHFLFGYQPMIEPDLENAFPLNYRSPIKYDDPIPPYGLGGYVVDAERVSPPQGGDATIPVEARQDWGYTTKDVALGYTAKDVVDAMVMIGRALARDESASDDRYDEPQATYPEMIMEQSL